MGTNTRRLIHPKLNPAGLMSAAGAVYAVVTMIFNAYNHGGIISTPVILAAIAAVSALLTRQVVTPLADPVDGAGRPLVPAGVFDDIQPAEPSVVPPGGMTRAFPQALGPQAATSEEPLRRYESGPPSGDLA